MGAFLDLIFPTEEKPTADKAAAVEAREAEQLKSVEESTTPGEFSDAYDKLLADENERLKSVESRLGGLLGLTSITATLLVGGMMGLVNGSLGNGSRAARALGAIGAFYLSLQIICSTLASVRGLERASWPRPSVGDLIPNPQLGPIQTGRERAIEVCKRYHATDRNVNYKVTQMAIAHTAIRNFAIGSVLIAVLGLTAILFQTPENSTVNAIRKDSDLQKLLRGPQGPAGPPGPAAALPAGAPTAHTASPQKSPHDGK